MYMNIKICDHRKILKILIVMMTMWFIGTLIWVWENVNKGIFVWIGLAFDCFIQFCFAIIVRKYVFLIQQLEINNYDCSQIEF